MADESSTTKTQSNHLYSKIYLNKCICFSHPITNNDLLIYSEQSAYTINIFCVVSITRELAEQS